jgi:hypothetical protein
MMQGIILTKQRSQMVMMHAPLWSRFCITLIQKFSLLDKVMSIDEKVRIAYVLQTVESHVQVVMSPVANSRNGSPF